MVTVGSLVHTLVCGVLLPNCTLPSCAGVALGHWQLPPSPVQRSGHFYCFILIYKCCTKLWLNCREYDGFCPFFGIQCPATTKWRTPLSAPSWNTDRIFSVICPNTSSLTSFYVLLAYCMYSMDNRQGIKSYMPLINLLISGEEDGLGLLNIIMFGFWFSDYLQFVLLFHFFFGLIICFFHSMGWPFFHSLSLLFPIRSSGGVLGSHAV